MVYYYNIVIDKNYCFKSNLNLKTDVEIIENALNNGILDPDNCDPFECFSEAYAISEEEYNSLNKE